MKKAKGFTLIELLIVIAVLGILIVAVLSAINPAEQIKKSRDTQRRADAKTLMDAIDRFYATYQCNPWDGTAGVGIDCDGTVTAFATAAVADTDFTGANALEPLIEQQELKSGFENRRVFTVASPELWLTVEAGTNNVNVCYEPESQAGRNGAYGETVDANDGTGAITTCSTSANYPSADCYVCVEQ